MYTLTCLSTIISQNANSISLKNNLVSYKMYRDGIYEKVKAARSSIVILPIGCGKLGIVMKLLKHFLVVDGEFFSEKKVLLLATTCVLVRQFVTSILIRLKMEGIRNVNVLGHSGNVELPLDLSDYQVFVMTPASFLETDGLKLRDFEMVVMDKVEFVMKRHPCRLIAQEMNRLETNVKWVGLSSVYYGKMLEREVEEACEMMKVEMVCTATVEEMEEYVFELPKVTMDLYHLFETQICVYGRYHLHRETHGRKGMLAEFFESIADCTAHPVTILLHDAMIMCECILKKLDKNFKCPGFGSMPLHQSDRVYYNMTQEWCFYAKEKVRVMKDRADTLHVLYTELEFLYGAIQIALISRQMDIDLAIMYLKMFSPLYPRGNEDVARCFQLSPIFRLILSLQRLNYCYEDYRYTFKKMPFLRAILKAYADQFKNQLRCVIVVRFTKVAEMIHQYLQNLKDEKDQNIYRVCTVHDASFNEVSPSDLQLSNENKHKFENGEYNVVVTTNTNRSAFPNTNAYIQFDAPQSILSIAQDIALHSPQLNSNDSLNSTAQAKLVHTKVINHTNNSGFSTEVFKAFECLTTALASNLVSKLSMLNTFVAQSGLVLVEEYQRSDCQTEWLYKSLLEVPGIPRITQCAQASSKKSAKIQSAILIVDELSMHIPQGMHHTVRDTCTGDDLAVCSKFEATKEERLEAFFDSLKLEENSITTATANLNQYAQIMESTIEISWDDGRSINARWICNMTVTSKDGQECFKKSVQHASKRVAKRHAAFELFTDCLNQRRRTAP